MSNFSKIFKSKVLYLLFVLLFFLFSLVLYYRINSFSSFILAFKSFLGGVHSLLNYSIATIGKTSLTISSILVFTLFISLGFTLATLYKKTIFGIRNKYKDRLSYNTSVILANIGYYTIITLVFLSSLKLVGIDLSSLSLIVGALSVGIGFGLQNVISNFISGIILIFEKSIKVGDYLELADGNKGEVLDIRIRSTTIRTNDNIDIIIPNQKIIEDNIINRTLNDNKVRFKIPFGVAYGTNIKDMEKSILSALRNSDLTYMKTGDYAPTIVMTGMGDNSINFELFVWTRGKTTLTPNRTKSDFLKLIYNTLNENNIVIPFPQTDLHIKDAVPLEIKLMKD